MLLLPDLVTINSFEGFFAELCKYRDILCPGVNLSCYSNLKMCQHFLFFTIVIIFSASGGQLLMGAASLTPVLTKKQRNTSLIFCYILSVAALHIHFG